LTHDPADDNKYEDIPPFKVNYAPEKLLNKLDSLRAYRLFYRQVRGALKQEEATNLRYAKEIVLGIYRARINGMVAGMYRGAFDLAQQLNRSQTDEQTKMRQSRLGRALPVVAATFFQEREDRVFGIEELAGNFARRLDFIRNGAAWRDSSDFSPISPELAKLADELSKKSEKPKTTEAQIPLQVVEKLDSIRWNAGQMKELAEAVLTKWQLLSNQQASWTDVETRDGFAADARWQVIITPKAKIMSVDGSKRTLKIPEKFDRTLTQDAPAGVLPVLAHELTHLLQCDYDYQVGQLIPLAKIQGRRTTTMREAGTIFQEDKIQAMFDRQRPANAHYLRALQAKLSGGNRLEVARAFYDSHMRDKEPSQDKQKTARELAADRILRFYNHGGHDSYPLNYLEQELIARSLSHLPQEKIESLLIAGVSFDLSDAALLHKMDLLNIPEKIDRHPADEVWRVFSEKYLPDILASN
ncbi:MAG: hypothetical protein AAB896_00685, partial [Patescibacteria group bacterium]